MIFSKKINQHCEPNLVSNGASQDLDASEKLFLDQ